MNIFINFADSENEKAADVVELLRSHMVDFSMNLNTNVPNISGIGTHNYYRIHDFKHREIIDRDYKDYEN